MQKKIIGSIQCNDSKIHIIKITMKIMSILFFENNRKILKQKMSEQ